MSDLEQSQPGSPKGVAKGCTCSPERNQQGEGIPGRRGRYYECDWRCPVHGLDAVKKAMAAGDAPIVPSPFANDDEDASTRH